MNRDTICALLDDALVDHVRQLRRREREHTALLLAHLVEVDGRRLHLRLGFGSFFAYLTEGLGYPEDAAAKRSRVTRLARRFPQVLDRLASGQLHLSGAVVLAPHLTEDNAGTLLAEAGGKSKRAIERLVAELAPRPDVASSIRKLQDPSEGATPTSQPALLDDMAAVDPPRGGSPVNSALAAASPPAPAPKRSAAAPRPLGRARFKVTFTASQTLVDKTREPGQ